MPTFTRDQMGTYYYLKTDIMAGSYLESRTWPGLRALWAAIVQDSAWTDQSGFSNDLSLVSLATSDVGIATEWPGVLLPYVSFDGVNDYAYIADNTALSVTGDLTLWALVYPEELGRDQGIVSKWLTTGNLRSYALYLDSSDRFTLAISSNGTAQTTVSSAAITKVNKWYLVIARYDAGASLSIMVNDAALVENTTSIPASIFDNARELQIGQYNEDSAARFNGRIAQVGLAAYHVPETFCRAFYSFLTPDIGPTDGADYVAPPEPEILTLYAVADTYISAADTSTNFGSATTMIIGVAANRRCLVEFDLSTIPAGATINSATLRCYVNASLGNGVTLSVAAYRVIRNWVEGETTWNIAQTGTNWGTAGCSNTTTDRDGTAEDTQNIEFGDVGGWVEWDLTSLVTEWMGGTANEGVILVNTNGYSASRFTLQTREGANPPELVVNYTKAA